MGMEGLLVIGLIVAVLVLLATEKASLDAVGVGLLLVLVAAGEIFHLIDPGFDPDRRLLSLKGALDGFGNYAVLTLAALYVVGEGLNRTGALEFLARAVLRYSKGRERRLLFLVCTIAAAISAVINDTGVVVVFLPVLLGMARKTGIAPSRLLMPLAFSTLLGGMCTVVGTSTNLLVSGAAENLGQAPLEMFELTPVGVPLTVAGVLFMALFAKRLLPVRTSLAGVLDDSSTREYVTEVVIGPTSNLIGRSYKDVFQDSGAELMFFVRSEEILWPPYFSEAVQAGDVVMVRGGADQLVQLQSSLGLKMVNDTRFDPHTMRIFEIAVAPHSQMVGRRIGDLHLWRDYDCVTVAVLREGRHIRDRASNLLLRPGDLLLVCGADSAEAKIRASSDFYLLRSAHDVVVLRELGRRALAITGVVMLLFTFSALTGVKVIPQPLAALLGALAMVASGCMTPARAYRAIDWPILVFVVGTLALGRAMANSGVAALFAEGIVGTLQSFGPIAVLAGLIFLCILFNALISHAAVAVLLTPIAIEAAQAVAQAEGLAAGEPAAQAVMRAFLLAICFGGSTCFATPIGHQVNLMVYGPGGYRYADFLRFGLPLSLIAWVISTAGLALLFGL